VGGRDVTRNLRHHGDPRRRTRACWDFAVNVAGGAAARLACVIGWWPRWTGWPATPLRPRKTTWPPRPGRRRPSPPGRRTRCLVLAGAAEGFAPCCPALLAPPAGGCCATRVSPSRRVAALAQPPGCLWHRVAHQPRPDGHRLAPGPRVPPEADLGWCSGNPNQPRPSVLQSGPRLWCAHRLAPAGPGCWWWTRHSARCGARLKRRHWPGADAPGLAGGCASLTKTLGRWPGPAGPVTHSGAPSPADPALGPPAGRRWPGRAR